MNGTPAHVDTTFKPSLKESEVRYRRLFEAAQDGILILDARTGAITDVNPFLINLLGYSRLEFIEKKLWEVGAFRDTEASKEAFQALQHDKYIRYKDLPLKAKDGRLIPVEFVSNVYEVDGKKVIQCNIRDITERKRADAANAQLAAIVESTDDAIIGQTLEGFITSWNMGAQKLYGYSAAEAIGQNISFIVPPDYIEELHNVLAQLYNGEKVGRIETMRLRKDGIKLDVALTLSPIPDTAGKVVAAASISRDISEGKHATQALRVSEEKYRSLIEQINDGVYATDAAGVYTFANSALARIYGVASSEELLGRHFAELGDSPRHAEVTQAFQGAMEAGRVLDVINGKIERGDGTVAFIEIKPTLTDKAGQIVGSQGIVRDITERKQREQQIRESEERFRAIIDHAPFAIALLDTQGHLTDSNLRLSEMVGYSHDELSKMEFSEFTYPEDVDEDMRLFTEMITGKIHGYTLEKRFVHKKGNLVWVNLSVTMLQDANGLPKDIIGMAEDITERKQAQTLQQAVYRITEAAETSQSLEDLYPQIHQIISSVMPAENFYITLYDKARDLLNFPYFKDVEDTDFLGGIQPGTGLTAYVLRTGKSLLCTQAMHDDLERRGEVKLLGVPSAIWLGVPLIVEGKTIGAMVVQDYSDPKAYGEREQHILELVSGQVAIAIRRKQAEAALRESEIRYQSLARISPVGIFRTDPNGVTVYVNPMWCQISGLSEEQALGDGWLGAVHPEDKERLIKGWQQATLQHQISYSDYRFIRGDGTIAWVMGQAVPEMNSENQVVGYVGTITDITERKRAEEALAWEQYLLRMLLDNLPDHIYFKDRDGRFTRISRSLAEAFSLSESPEALGKTDFDFFTEAHARPAFEVEQNIIRTGQPLVGFEEKETWADGRLTWVYTTKMPLQDKAGNIIGTFGISSDITERKRAEERMQRQLEHLTALSAIERVISSNFDLRLSLAEILTHVTTELDVAAADILILNTVTQTLDFGAERGFRTQAIRKAQVRLGASYAGRIAVDRQALHIPDLRNEPDHLLLTTQLKGENFVSYFGLPLIAKGQVNGVLEVFHRAELEPDAEWHDYLNALAGEAAIAIENSTLFEKFQRSNLELTLAYDATIEGWSHALDLRDKETEGHTQRVTKMTLKLARTFGLGEAELMQVRWGALLHDIGKMGVPDDILLKPGPLTDEEWIIMKKHPDFAYEMLAPIRYLRQALDIPYCHHEKWDGSGYPRGLKGEQIPLTARIFAVVDVWDALMSDRPYRKAWTSQKVREHIQAGSGTHFDPQVVEIFLREIVNADEEGYASVQ